MSPGGQTQRGLPGARGRAPGGRGRSAPSLEDQPGEEWRTDLEDAEEEKAEENEEKVTVEEEEVAVVVENEKVAVVDE